MTTLSEELRRAREEKNIPLAEISRSTRINMKYLEALDEGKFDILPQAYIRAFIREYSLAVGLSPVEMLQKYDALVVGKAAAGQTSLPASGAAAGTIPASQGPARTANAAPSEELLVKQRSMRTVVIVSSIIMLCALVLAYVANYVWLSRSGSLTRETPFQDVVREKESAYAPAPKKDSTHAVGTDTVQRIAKADAPLSRDSLTLTVRATGVVWMSIVRDTGRATEVLCTPGQQLFVRAKRQFIVTTGNAGGTSLLLNGRDLGPLGKEGIVLRHIIVTAAGIVKLPEPSKPSAQKPPQLKPIPVMPTH